jgi:hypothetical protein
MKPKLSIPMNRETALLAAKQISPCARGMFSDPLSYIFGRKL